MYTEINGIKTYYLHILCKNQYEETVLILHGWGCDGGVYSKITEHLQKRYNVVIPDLPGFGKTEEPKEAWGVREYAEFIIEFCKKIGLENFILFGHSLGGRISLKLLSEKSDVINNDLKISHAIITGGAGIMLKKSLKSKIRGRIYKAGRFALNTGIMKKLLPNALENFRRRNGSPDYIAASPKMRQCLVKIVNEDLAPLLSGVKASVLLIWGENDDQTPLNDGRLMERLIPDAGLAVIENAGHYAFLERPGLFNDILDAFLK